MLVPLCGRGERFAAAGHAEPKPLVPVLGKALVFHALDGPMAALLPGDRLLVAYSGPRLDPHGFAAQIRARYPAAVASAQLLLLPLHVEETRGAADTVRLALEALREEEQKEEEEARTAGTAGRPVLLLDGDTYYTFDVVAEARAVATAGECAVVCFEEGEADGLRQPPPYSYTAVNGEGGVVAVAEKRRMSRLANTGAYLFRDGAELHRHAVRVLARDDLRINGEYYTSSVICDMLQEVPFRAIVTDAARIVSLGTPAQVAEYVARVYAFLFDLDGTLALTDDLYREAWAELLCRLSPGSSSPIEMTEQLFAEEVRGQSDAAVVARLLPCLVEQVANVSRLKDELLCARLALVRPVPGAREFMKRVRELGHRVCVVTNSNRTAAESVLRQLGLVTMVDHLVVGAECARPKPSSDPYAAALTALGGLPSSRAVVFEDSESGMTAARGVSPACVVGICTIHEPEYMVSLGADVVTHDFAELLSHATPQCTPVDVLAQLLTRAGNQRGERLARLCSMTAASLDTAPENVRLRDQKLKGGYIADVIRVEAMDSSNRQVRAVLKMHSDAHDALVEDSLGLMARKLDLYGREAYFYESISAHVARAGVRIPRFMTLVRDPCTLDTVGVLMEDVLAAAPGRRVGTDLAAAPIETILRIVDRMAVLHAAFWGKPLTNAFPQLRRHDDPLFRPAWGAYVRAQWPRFEAAWCHVLTDRQRELGRLVVERFDDVQARMAVDDGHLTLCHGDIKAGNIVFDAAGSTHDPLFLDWQHVAHGRGVQDLVFLLIESFDVDAMAMRTELLKRFYHLKLQEHGVSAVAYDARQLDDDFRTAACYYPFFVAVWFGVTPRERLIDAAFPHTFVTRLFAFLEANVPPDCLLATGCSL